MAALAVLYLVVRTLVIVALVYAALIALTHWAVRNKHITPFGPWPRFIRKVSDPVLDPVERRILRAGGNPQNAPFWLLGIVVAAGLVLVSLTSWLIETAVSFRIMTEAGP